MPPTSIHLSGTQLKTDTENIKKKKGCEWQVINLTILTNIDSQFDSVVPFLEVSQAVAAKKIQHFKPQI